jgi:hypothetical protein
MPRLEIPIGEDGPIIDVRIWIGTERKGPLDALGLPVPPLLSIRGLVDTGNRLTAIQRVWVHAMGLPVLDWISRMSSMVGAEERQAPAYQVRMTLGPIEAPDSPRWWTILAVGVTVVSSGAVALIGQNPLATCLFIYDCRKRRLKMWY